ncbi:SSI family serine proteinase inhibitor [Streptomyces sp. YIM 130001]|uniref:SSI family serine proteinase inhibitor n=1 Tax=Streptomyces sp. YIM 130001 TaxID=2259644 RepID=UPI000E64D973|nr:SSI family serine proteinase inhibitor [Streptomyces sp. YIM 130001]
MVKTVRNGFLAAAAAGLLLAAGAGTAQAESHQESSARGNWLMLSVTQGTDDSGPTERELLRCPSSRSEHPDRWKACWELRLAHGDINRIPDRDGACPMIYRPVTAKASGMWEGRRVQYGETFSNSCVMHGKTGSVFQLSS